MQALEQDGIKTSVIDISLGSFQLKAFTFLFPFRKGSVSPFEVVKQDLKDRLGLQSANLDLLLIWTEKKLGIK